MPRSLPPVLAAVLVAYSVHQVLSALSAPVVSVLSLTTSQLGLVLSIASVTIAVASPVWGVLVDAVGVRPVLLVGLGLCVVGSAGFAVAVTSGADETLTGDVAFAFVLVFRSVLFSAGLASVLVGALAVAGLSTSGETERTRAVGFVGAAQGVAVLLGPVLGGALTVASLALPLYVAPVLALLAAFVVFSALKPPTVTQEQVRFRPAEVVPAFGAGFFLYLSLAVVQAVVVYLAADRLDTRVGPGSIESLLFASGIGFLVAQGLLVPLLKWSPARLLLVGGPLALAGYALMAFAPSTALMALAFLVVSLGVGLAVTGFGAAASLGVGSRRQGLVAGLVTAVSGLAFLGGPVLSAVLHEVEPLAPVLLAGAAALVATGLAVVPALVRSETSLPN
ncbi:MFS transporter [Lentzea albida]|uniref:Na+/melibiose symporter n=1 Tax=Lentzea albida TaxID=65499 RepID=A0A1H9JTM8_9PSEU|nr:MFS transporter [Lentzea albida]SEQ90147.1 Na+/melibiose symporter [Lentzea albida]